MTTVPLPPTDLPLAEWCHAYVRLRQHQEACDEQAATFRAWVEGRERDAEHAHARVVEALTETVRDDARLLWAALCVALCALCLAVALSGEPQVRRARSRARTTVVRVVSRLV